LPAPDRGARPQSPTGEVGSKTQVAVDAKHTLVVVQEGPQAVTAGAPRRGIAIPAKAALAAAQRTVVAAMGAYQGEASNTWAEAGLAP
jgi:hypothetical protein